MKADADALLFSMKSFAAAMLAYYISLCIGLPKPYWAIVTVYIVSQTSAGASLSRGVYRFLGTFIGAAATVAIVPNFVNDPLACSVILACWIGLCLYVSLLDRTPRAYAYVLAGYTASLIGFPCVLDPGAVFETASVRVQEISIGILCAVLIHRFVVPKPMTSQFLTKLSTTLNDARRMANDALRGAPQEKSRRDRNQLAADLLALQGLATYLPYDPAPATPAREKLQLIHDRLARLLPLATEIEDRLHALNIRDHDTPEELTALLGDVETWITAAGATERELVAVQLIERARMLQARIGTNIAAHGDLLAANLAGHLAEMIELLHDCDRLGRDIATAGQSREVTLLRWRKRPTGYVYHRDSLMAARAASGAIVGIVIGCAFWIWSAWPDGALAVSVLGVCCALLGNVDAPAPNVVKFLVGSTYAVAISLIYSFVILPRVTEFAVLVAVLAPAFLLAGSIQARPPTTLMALGITLTTPILCGLGTTYTGDFAMFLNSAVALFAGTGFAVVSMTALQTVPVDAAINRLLRVSRRDVSRRACGSAPEEAHWTSLMIDRTALLLPRLRVSDASYADVLDDTVYHLRVGHAVDQLRRAVEHLEGDLGDEARELLLATAARFSARRQTKPVEALALNRRIETLMTLFAGSSLPERSRLLDILIDLRFALNPGGATHEERDS
ncbi:FUSC family protein [Steroidobacter flavus]|uniref:FUSC family protein n=1 Tax=Steroidobacter flavus TaxID=1842136 RepID=A0ABV8T2M4_9GAMM